MKLLPLLLFSNLIFAGFYGEDSRELVLQKDIKFYNSQGLYPVAFVPTEKISYHLDNVYLKAASVGQRWNMCSEERFYSQVAPADCSGFFIEKDKVMTAYHCISSLKSLSDRSFILNMGLKEAKGLTIIKNQVFKTLHIIESDEESDYAIIKVDRSIKGFISPQWVSVEIESLKKQEIAILGHPLGQALTLASGAKVADHDESKKEFYTDLDSFHLNSGSVVFSQKDFKILGLLKAGQVDMGARFEVGKPTCNELRENNLSQGHETVQGFWD